MTATWGGARTGAGRPAKGPIASEAHKTRPDVRAQQPVHIRARLARGIGTLSRGRGYRALRRAITLSLARTEFRIVHFALLRSRVELVVEATNKHALARGMQGFQVSAARWLNRAARRRGTVFVDRYWMDVLRTRVDVRDAIGRMPVMMQTAWPESWLLRVETVRGVGRRWFHTRADEDG